MNFPMELDDFDPSEGDLEDPANVMHPKDMEALGLKLSGENVVSGPCWEQVACDLGLNNDEIDRIRTYSQSGKKPPGVLLLQTWSKHSPETRTMMVLRSALERCNRDDVMDCFRTAVRNMNRVTVNVVVKYPEEIPDVSGRLQKLREEVSSNTSLRQIMENRLEGELTEYEIKFPKWARWTTPASKMKGDMVTIERVVCHDTPLKSVVDPVMDCAVSSSTDTRKLNNLLPNIEDSDTDNESSLGDTSLDKNIETYGENLDISPLKLDNPSGKSNILDVSDDSMDTFFSMEQPSNLPGCWPCHGRMSEEGPYVAQPSSPTIELPRVARTTPTNVQVVAPQVVYPVHTSPREIHPVAHISPAETHPVVYPVETSPSEIHSDSVVYHNVTSPRDTHPIFYDDHTSPTETPTYANIRTSPVSTPAAAGRSFDLGRRVSSKTLVNRASRHLKSVSGWFDCLTQEQMDVLLNPHLNEDGWYIVWRMRGHNDESEKLFVSVTHAGDKVHYGIRARAVDGRPCYYIFKERYKSHDVERLINHYRHQYIEPKVNEATGAVLPVQLKYPVTNVN